MMLMNEHFLNQIALRTVESWFLSMGFQPSGGWDEHDVTCRRQYGPHILWTVCARVPDDIDEDAAALSFSHYISEYNKLPSSVKFQPYGLQFYDCPCGCGSFVYATIYQ